MVGVIETVYRSGQVSRYACNAKMRKCNQSNAEHTWGMLALLYKLHPNPSPELVKAITFHDSDEFIGGDIPYHFKRANREFIAEHDRLSKAMAALKGIPSVEVTHTEGVWMEFLDRLESLLYVQLNYPHIAASPEWTNMAAGLMPAATTLGLDANEEIMEILGQPMKPKEEIFDRTHQDKICQQNITAAQANSILIALGSMADQSEPVLRQSNAKNLSEKIKAGLGSLEY